MTNHVVKFTESERGWGGEVWFNTYRSESEAMDVVRDCNKNYDGDLPTPDYYIIANYLGVMDVIPKGYKI